MFSYFILYFSFYSFMGWIGEVIYAYKNQKKFVNRGFLHGSFLSYVWSLYDNNSNVM